MAPRLETPAVPPRGLFVTGTGTGTGKTHLAAAIAATLAARGERVAVFKPVVTGLDEAGDRPDHELLRRAAASGQAPEAVAPYRFGPPVSPQLAAARAGVRIETTRLVWAASRAAATADFLIVEGVGGLMVPLAARYLVRDLALDLDLPLLVAARPGLGTINHSLLTVEAARSVGLHVAAVVFTPWPERPGELELSNRMAVASKGDVQVAALGHFDAGSPAPPVPGLPLEAWLPALGSEWRPRAAAA